MAELSFGSRFSVPGRKLESLITFARVYDKEKAGKRKNISVFKMGQGLRILDESFWEYQR